MAEKTQQTFANHQARSRTWLFIAVLALVGFITAVLLVYRNPREPVPIAFLCLAAALMGVVILLRGYATRLQDRIIRLEMQVRAARLGLEPQLARLTPRQAIAVRFASDAELPELMDRAIVENLDPIQIKRAVKDWQGDYARV